MWAQLRLLYMNRLQQNKQSEVASYCTMLRGNLEKNVSLARYTSWKVGGNADVLFQPSDVADLSQFLSSLEIATPITWLGRGTNVLVRDGGIRGVVILLHGVLNELDKINETEIKTEVGVSCAKLARFSADQNLVGAEFLAGIPGTVGGALAMNSGAYGSETWEFVTVVETIDRNGEVHNRVKNEFEIGYRSVSSPKDEWFLAAKFKFTLGDGQLAKNSIRELMDKRNNSQPVGYKSCGSVFRNPENDHAARLIEASNLKGVTIGGAQVSTKHANFIINLGDATAKNIEELIAKIHNTVRSEHGVELVPEVKIIGEPI